MCSGEREKTRCVCVSVRVSRQVVKLVVGCPMSHFTATVGGVCLGRHCIELAFKFNSFGLYL